MTIDITSAHKLSALADAVTAVCPIIGITLLDATLHTTSIEYDPSATVPQKAAAASVVSAYDWSDPAQATRINIVDRAAAISVLASGITADAKTKRAIAAIMVDEINTVRQWIVAFKAQTALATSLANLQTRVAALPDLPDRTLAQAKTALAAKINAGTVD